MNEWMSRKKMQNRLGYNLAVSKTVFICLSYQEFELLSIRSFEYFSLLSTARKSGNISHIL